MKRIALLAALLAVLPPATAANAAPAAASQSARSPEQQVTALFAKWNRPGTPGAVVSVIRDGKVLLSKGYGFADLERKVPLTAASRMTVGSMSKQFTAFSIHLLAQDGKLSLDDDIRTHLPYVPDFGTKITVRHLLHHTSGLRDYFDLMFFNGWRPGDVITQEEALTMVERQRALNFAPGQEYMYSNTNYMLLAMIVQRVSGKPLAHFARERIFDPLGMKDTQFLRGYGTVVPGRALPYVASATGGYDYEAVSDSADGAGGLVTTVGDLALWDRNFYDGRVGGMALVERMQAAGVLNNGKPINYASALFVDVHRGRRIVEHSGAISGFGAQLMRFPDQRFSVMVLANTSDLDIYQMPRKIADIFLEPAVGTPPATPEVPRKVFKEVGGDPARLKALAGFYALSPQAGIDFSEEHGQLTAKATGLPRMPVFAYGERNFFAKAIDAQFTFDAPGPDGIVAGGVLHQNGQDIPAKRVVRAASSADALKKFEGDFYSDELRVLYSVTSRNGSLILTHPRGTVALDINDKDELATGLLGHMKYQCGAQVCTGFTLSSERVRNLQFTKVALVAPGHKVTSLAASSTMQWRPDQAR